jgi:hypothetical protein
MIVLCGNQSVKISEPSDFKTYLSYYVGIKSKFIFSNFTSNDTACPVVSHKIVASKSDSKQLA